MPVSPWLIAGGAAALGLLATRPRVGRHPFPRAAQKDAEFAVGRSPVWPVASTSKHRKLYLVSYEDVNGKIHGSRSRRFKADRGERHHVGIDLYANAGDVVVAPESGQIVGVQNFLHGTDAILVQLDSGPVALLGEVERGSMKEFGLGRGSRVTKGSPVARVGLMGSRSHMLHFETYKKGTTANKRWYKGKPIPEQILDPTDYLLQAKARSEK